MGLKKGQTNNPKGRPRGSVNKVTKTTRKWLNDLLEGNREQIEKDFKELSPKERIHFFEKLMQYTMPKMQNVQAKIDMDVLSESQLDYLINEINKDIEDES